MSIDTQALPSGTCEPSTDRHTTTFTSGGETIHAWHYPAGSATLVGPAGRPAVVMAHGAGGTKDSGLESFARHLAAAGVDVLAFDYRGFGESGGVVRQRVDVSAQVDDYRAAITAARALEGVDPDKIVLWGVSLSGGHVISAAAGRSDVAAVISLTPFVDGRAAGALAARTRTAKELVRNGVEGVRSRLGTPRTIPLVAARGEMGCMTLEGSLEGYLAIAGPTWRNEVDAAIGLEIAGYRPTTVAGDVRCPVLVQIADVDLSAPPYAAAKAAVKARATVRHYPCDHFDVWGDGAWHLPAIRHQIEFLERLFA